jgi:hypothetical protein
VAVADNSGATVFGSILVVTAEGNFCGSK